jgi:hypothetical protein
VTSQWPSKTGPQRPRLCIFNAALQVAEYKLEFGNYANVDQGFARGEVTRRFDSVKQLFPCEDTLLSFDEVDDKRHRFRSKNTVQTIPQTLCIL